MALVCCFCNPLQCNNVTIIEAAAGETDRPAETQLQLQRRWQRRWLLKTRLTLEKLWDALNLCCGGTSACESRSCTHCNVTDNWRGKSRKCSEGVVREQLLLLRGRETSNCRVVELSRTHSAHSANSVTHSAHRLESRLHTEPVLQNRRQHSRGFYPLLVTTTSPYRATPLEVSFFKLFKYNAGIP